MVEGVREWLWLRVRRLNLDARRPLLLKVAVVGGILLASFYLGRRADQRTLMLLLAALGGGALAVFALGDMAIPLTLLVMTSSAVDFSIGTGTQSRIVPAVILVAFMTGLWVVRMLVRERRVTLVPTPLNWPMLLFMAALAVSWVAGYAIWNPRAPRPDNLLTVQVGQVAMFVLSFAAFLLVANHRVGESTLKIWTVAIAAIGLVYMAWDASPARSLNPLPAVRGAMLMWPVALVVAQLLFNPELRRGLRLACLLSLLPWVWWTLHKVSYKSGWVPALLAVGLLILLRSRKLFVLFAIAAVIFLVLNWEVIYPATYKTEDPEGSLLRPLIWWDVIRMTIRSPLLGLGPASYMFYWHDPSFVPESRLAGLWERWSQWGYSPPSHNLFVDVFAQAGLVGLAFFVWTIAAAVWVGWRLRKRFAPGFMRAHVYGVLCGFVALTISSFIFADWLIPFVYNITIAGFRDSVYSWLLLGTLVSLEKSLVDRSI